MANPNRVRALIGTFATANQTGFNRADGAGYDYFADAVLEIEQRNPQLAARLATALRSWRSLEPVRQAKAREALLSICRRRKSLGRSARHRRTHAGLTDRLRLLVRSSAHFRVFLPAATGQAESPLIPYGRFGSAASPDRQQGNVQGIGHGRSGRVGRARWLDFCPPQGRPRGNVVAGNARIIAAPAYRRLLAAEPLLKRSIPILIVIFLIVVASVRFLSLMAWRDDVERDAKAMLASPPANSSTR